MTQFESPPESPPNTARGTPTDAVAHRLGQLLALLGWALAIGLALHFFLATQLVVVGLLGAAVLAATLKPLRDRFPARRWYSAILVGLVPCPKRHPGDTPGKAATAAARRAAPGAAPRTEPQPRKEREMAEIPIERKRGTPVWLWLLALLLVAGLIWWFVAAAGDEEEQYATPVVGVEPVDEPVFDTEPVEPVTTAGEMNGMEGVTLTQIVDNPDEYVNETFPETEVSVGEVATDRGFWIEDQGERLFALLQDQPQEQPVDINPGQRLRIENGTLRDPSYLPELEGDPLDQDTQRIAQAQDIFLVVDERFVDILAGGVPQPGTDPAATIQ